VERLGTFRAKGLEEKLLKALKGTTTVGIAFNDFVVLAADRRATSGFYISHKRAKKILMVDDHIAATISGLVGDAQWLIDRLRLSVAMYKVTNNEPIPVSAAANLASMMLFENRPIMIAHILIGGVDREGGSLYSIDWLGTVTKERFTATGSGSPFAISILESEYKESMSEDEAVKLAIRAVRAALRRDPGSGEGVDVVVVTRSGYKELRGEDVLPS